MYVHARRAKPPWLHASLFLADASLPCENTCLCIATILTATNRSSRHVVEETYRVKERFESLSLLGREILPAPRDQVSITHLDVECLEQSSNDKTTTTRSRGIMVLPASHLQSGLFHGVLALLCLLALQTGKAYCARE